MAVTTTGMDWTSATIGVGHEEQAEHRLPVPHCDVALHSDAGEGRVGGLEELRDGVGDGVLRVSSAIGRGVTWYANPPAFWRVMTMNMV